ncbi:unnamed protein product [Rotaria socialis]|uniref:DEAD/DEAH-box helicase domain-containing protein n=2 Tax=Rotaria socialis TaxID=392032 RepID=A0A821N6E7_9BILA|nr:unnamed protein product [Rotaria socialis]
MNYLINNIVVSWCNPSMKNDYEQKNNFKLTILNLIYEFIHAFHNYPEIMKEIAKQNLLNQHQYNVKHGLLLYVVIILLVLHSTVIYGSSRKNQIFQCETGVEIIIATPGRLNDLVMSNVIDIRSVTFFVLDEADRVVTACSRNGSLL